MDEALEVLPLHWSGEPFSYQGLHFDARDMIARPVPTQSPIPIWIGGNSDLTLRRVASKAQGWMPHSGSATTSASARTPHLATLDDVRAKLTKLRGFAGERADELSILFPYVDPSIREPHVDVERHLDMIVAIEALGVTHMSIEAPAGEKQTRDFLDAFGELYIRGKGGRADRASLEILTAPSVQTPERTQLS
jgi:alkanesulfonate monooxygenase SsuD/methylene tetrahydromethanopterin reductase-like flavin-dependent oxidoreductase (luciferase family)